MGCLPGSSALREGNLRHVRYGAGAMTLSGPPFRTAPIPRPLVLVILDGFGEREAREGNAVRLAKTPRLDELHSRYPNALLGTSGPDVGLPPGQMGNSEVGHLNFGAGRIAQMDIARIDTAVFDGSLATNPVIAEAIGRARQAKGRVHLLGLLSDGGVHSTLEHLFALIDICHGQGVPVVVHAFLDGRDVAPKTAPGYLARLLSRLEGKGVIGTVAGRFFAMDRDNRWERVERAFAAIVRAEGPRATTAESGVLASFENDKTDEFVEPFVVGDYQGVMPNDAAIHFNFRPDRARELTRALAIDPFDAFDRKMQRAPFSTYACMTTYDGSFGLPIAFPKASFPDIFPELLARAGKKQLRCAETEKYAHVTYFFNGGREEPFPNEDRTMIPSPKEVATYDLKPAMSAVAVADAVVAAIEGGTYDFVLVNFANPDMVGHSGNLDAAVAAVEAVDACVGRLVDATLARKGALLITADHGNCETMIDPVTGNPHTAHTTNPVPIFYVSDLDQGARLESGRICDVAPTMLALMGLEQPAAMTGHNLIARFG
jgi:2,3-bisphosphoglycerate-independent phosphoglycerate mutase